MFRCVKAHVHHVEDLHFCAMWRQIHTPLCGAASRARMAAQCVPRRSTTPLRAALLFIDSNLIIVLEF